MDVAIISAMSALVGSSIGAMSSFSTTWLEVIAAAEQVVRVVVNSYIAPNRSLKELRDAVLDGEKLDPLAHFADACRQELGGMTA